MQLRGDLDINKICHRCGNKIRWWDRFRGYKLQCPSCEKIIHDTVSARILATKTPEAQSPTIISDFSRRMDEELRMQEEIIRRVHNDSQESRSSSIDPRMHDRQFYETQMSQMMMMYRQQSPSFGRDSGLLDIYSRTAMEQARTASLLNAMRSQQMSARDIFGQFNTIPDPPPGLPQHLDLRKPDEPPVEET